MALSIKNEEAHSLANLLAQVRGISATQAVTDALRHELEREQARRGEDGLAEALLTIGRRCAGHMQEPTSSADHGDLLYDESGLPR